MGTFFFVNVKMTFSKILFIKMGQKINLGLSVLVGLVFLCLFNVVSLIQISNVFFLIFYKLSSTHSSANQLSPNCPGVGLGSISSHHISSHKLSPNSTLHGLSNYLLLNFPWSCKSRHSCFCNNLSRRMTEKIDPIALLKLILKIYFLKI